METKIEGNPLENDIGIISRNMPMNYVSDELSGNDDDTRIWTTLYLVLHIIRKLKPV